MKLTSALLLLPCFLLSAAVALPTRQLERRSAAINDAEPVDDFRCSSFDKTSRAKVGARAPHHPIYIGGVATEEDNIAYWLYITGSAGGTIGEVISWLDTPEVLSDVSQSIIGN
ncbi:uncharacterized protein C8Q71DRAFT_848463 [Rhodofomes roseus]|uniref:Uncharacterized protein n=1 Tax=Rhodofomes roseus TaxID=34475 RepID=A0ABQ8KF11_9APHY|nr:uncharacterized protein C8Q71DRAFT_848463 [Rhodofomes roseus]KAH9836223.1 hypothetical protein C8Q71DRAFT_848463 [Rhodofomes roseus]